MTVRSTKRAGHKLNVASAILRPTDQKPHIHADRTPCARTARVAYYCGIIMTIVTVVLSPHTIKYVCRLGTFFARVCVCVCAGAVFMVLISSKYVPGGAKRNGWRLSRFAIELTGTSILWVRSRIRMCVYILYRFTTRPPPAAVAVIRS